MMKQSGSTKTVSRALMFMWHKNFSEGSETLKDNKGCGRKQVVENTVYSPVPVEWVALILNGRTKTSNSNYL